MSRPRAHGVLGFFSPLIFYAPSLIPWPHTHTSHAVLTLWTIQGMTCLLPWEKAKGLRHSLKTNTVKWHFCSPISSPPLPLPPTTPQTSKWLLGQRNRVSEQHFCSLCSYSPAEASSGCSSCRQICIQEDRWQLQKPRWKVTRQKLWHQEI